MSEKKEAGARIKINKLLEKAGWRFFDSPQGPADIQLEQGIEIRPEDIEQKGDDFEKTKQGRADYLLLDKQAFPLAVLEAKRAGKNPLDGKEQARKYARSLNARFVILSNGNLHYFWDLEIGNPEIISEFPTKESVERRIHFKPNIKKLYKELVDEDYIAVSQDPYLLSNPDWQNPKSKQAVAWAKGLSILRPYQLKALQTLQAKAKEGGRRFLFEMATGTGKTLLSAAVIKLFLRTGNAKRVLFLVDRLELEDQAFKNFKNYLKNDYHSVIYKKSKEDWRRAEIVISTVQSLTAEGKYRRLFSPMDFELLISDEAHRSIGGSARPLFEYFIGYKLGLTATPRDYLKNADTLQLSERDPRKWERRLLLDTYSAFGCENSAPTFKYSLMDGAKQGFLTNPVVLDARTDITTKLLSEQGYSVWLEDEEGEEGEERIFHHKDFERKFFSEKTNRLFCKTFLENALKDPISGEIGKSLVFCVSQKHAGKITQILNQMADKLWPGKYNSDFAVQITSHVEDAGRYAVNFAGGNLNGHSRFREGYRTSKTRVCVTVRMMTTGYDCEDILNLCLMRPVFSPTDFVQMKGRGTRKFTFKHKDEKGCEYKAEKQNFKLFDFFAVCEFFEEKFKYDEALKLPPQTSAGESEGGDLSPVSIDEVEIHKPDTLKTLTEARIGEEGMRVDREFWGLAQSRLSKDQDLAEAVQKEKWQRAEKIVQERHEDKPELFLSLAKIRRAENLDRRITWKEVLQRVFGLIDRFRNREELLQEECQKFISIYKPENRYTHHIVNYMRCYITDPDFRRIIDKKDYGQLYVYAGFGMEEFQALNGKTGWREKNP